VIVIDNKIISDDIVENKFACDLAQCKGRCCEDGDAGAPLSEEELDNVVAYYDTVKPYLTQEAIAQVEKNGMYEYSKEFGWVTPTLTSDNEICVYAFREKDGLIKCAFEQAFNEGKITWKKPISCHLYPIIAYHGKHGDYERLNYEPRKVICNAACTLGQQLELPVYKFLKEPLIRKYGKEFYKALEEVAVFKKAKGA
jgi:hypothetical protein